jgi:hypothetical protein
MRVLERQIRSSDVPALAEKKSGWGDRIKVKAEAQENAAKPVQDADAKVEVLTGYEKSLAKLAQLLLTRLKRDYKNAGMTEHQIHEIIPDYVPRPRAKPAGPQPPPGSPPAPPA